MSAARGPEPPRGLLRRELRLSRVEPRLAWSLLGLALLVLFFLREAVFQGRAFYARDIHLQWYGQVQSFVASVASGSWPLWDPYVSFGQPLLANANNQVLYPLTWLNLVVRPWTYYTLFLGLHLLFSGCGVLALARRFGISPTGSFTAAAIWIASGPFLSLGNVWNHLAAAAWIPWVILAADRAWSSGRPTHALLWGAAMGAQILAGSPDFFALTALVLLVHRLLTVRGRDRRSTIGRFALSAAIAFSFAIALSAAQVLPSLELADRSERWRQAERTRTYWSVHPVAMLQTLVPVSWDALPLQQRYRASIFEEREPYLFSLYLGLPVVALGLAAWAGPARYARTSLAATALGALLVALGKHGFVYDAAMWLLPPLKVLRFPAKAMVFVAFAFSLLAGLGFDSWTAAPRGELRRPWRAFVLGPLMAVTCAAGLGAVLLVSRAETLGPLFLAPVPGGPSFSSALAPVARRLGTVAIIGLLLLALAALRSHRAGWAPVTAVVVAILAVAGLAAAHATLNPTAPRALFAARPDVLQAIRQQDSSRLYVYDYLAAPGLSERHLGRSVPYLGERSDSPLLWRSALAMRLCLLPPTSAAWGIYDSFSRDVLGIQPRFLAELNALLVSAEGTPAYARLLRLGAVGQVVALHADGLDDLIPVATLPGPYAEPLRVLDVPDHVPRAYLVGNARVAEGAAGLEALLDPSFDPALEVVLEAGRALRSGAHFTGTSRILALEPDHIRLETDASEAGYAVLVDGYDPGWKATVDGRRAPVLRANVAFRAVEVPAGSHTVELLYRPAAFLTGLAISVAALLVAVAVVARARP